MNLIFPSPFGEVFLGTTQQHQTKLKINFQELNKFRLNEMKNVLRALEYAVLSEKSFWGKNRQEHC